MNIIDTSLDLVKILVPKTFHDDRGFFMESYHLKKFADTLQLKETFVQDNHSRSQKNVLRGLHYQLKQPQGKLVRVVCGEIYDVAVDMRKSSPTFGKWTSAVLNDQNFHQIWIPAGFAHGFLVLSDFADVIYKTTDFYDPGSERTVRWNDPELGIEWPLDSAPIVSARDQQGQSFRQAEAYP